MLPERECLCMRHSATHSRSLQVPARRWPCHASGFCSGGEKGSPRGGGGDGDGDGARDFLGCLGQYNDQSASQQMTLRIDWAQASSGRCPPCKWRNRSREPTAGGALVILVLLTHDLPEDLWMRLPSGHRNAEAFSLHVFAGPTQQGHMLQGQAAPDSHQQSGQQAYARPKQETNVRPHSATASPFPQYRAGQPTAGQALSAAACQSLPAAASSAAAANAAAAAAAAVAAGPPKLPHPPATAAAAAAEQAIPDAAERVQPQPAATEWVQPTAAAEWAHSPQQE